MRTPAGTECPFYYADYHRGRETEECRQAASNPDSAPWQPRDCARCPIPAIVQANASPHLRLKLTIRPRLMGFVRQMHVEAWCDKHDVVVEDPYTGCPLCAEENPGLKLFKDALG